MISAVFLSTRGQNETSSRGRTLPQQYRRTQKCTGAVTPSSGFLTDLRRSECRSGGHQPQVLLPRCNHHSRWWRALRQVASDRSFRKLRSFLREQSSIAQFASCSKEGMGRNSPSRCAFVHFTGWPSASAYRRPVRLHPPAPRARRRGNLCCRRHTDQVL